MARLTVIADDLTGALDTGVQFANRCVSVRVAAVNAAAVPEEIFHADVAVIDAEVRHKTSQQAYNICLGLVQQALRGGTDTVYIKTDSGPARQHRRHVSGGAGCRRCGGCILCTGAAADESPHTRRHPVH